MTAAGLLALVLSVSPVGAPGDRPPTVADEVRRWAESPSNYNPAPLPPKLVELPREQAGRATIDDTAGRVTLELPADVAGRVTLDGTAAPAQPATGFVYEPAYSIDPNMCVEPAAYVPQAGDIVLVVSDHLVWKILFAIALLHEPYHVGIVVRMPDGSYGMLEAGPPDQTAQIRITPLAERLASDTGRVYIRRRCVPLSDEQSDALTGFAQRQEGKPYAYIRFLAQGTPLRSRGPVRTHFMGKSRGEPCSYFCSELVMEALVSAGLVDPETARPRATAPSDIFYDESMNLWLNQYLKLYPWWCPPQRWVAGTCACGR